MKQLTHLKDNLYCIEVPASSIRHYINDSDDRVNYTWLHPKYGKCLDGQRIPKGDWKILGTASKDKISFDVAPYVGNLFTKEAWKDYRITEVKGYGNYPLLIPEESLYSLLNSKGYYWENPKIHPVYAEPTSFDHYEKLKLEWQSFQDTLLTGIILLIEKVK